jgi:hypothetical protein
VRGFCKKNMGGGGPLRAVFLSIVLISSSPFGSRSSDYDRSLHSLHRYLGLHLIRSLTLYSLRIKNICRHWLFSRLWPFVLLKKLCK